MTTTTDMLKSLRRPRLLVRAARFGLSEYDRDKDLKKLMKTNSTPSPSQAVDGLLIAEAQMEDTRKAGGCILFLRPTCRGTDRALGRASTAAT